MAKKKRKEAVSFRTPLGVRNLGCEDPARPAEAPNLSEAERYKAQLKAIELFGTIDFDPAYDYKAERRRKRSI